MGSPVGRDNFCRVMLAVSARGGGRDPSDSSFLVDSFFSRVELQVRRNLA